jgi:16S rRNA (adenine1518-N6/adenine1519-N6)-dimethyltransferase
MKFETKKSLGQNFLNSDYVPKKMCVAADLKKGDLVLEIGPGTGALTKELLNQEAKVIAVEADPRAIASLEETFPEAIAHGQLSLHHLDARKLDLFSLGLEPHSYKAVSNIPYYLSGLLFRTLLESDCQPNTLVFLVQKEVAERIARDKKESLLSLSVKVFGEPKYVATVKRGHFTPQPKVDSAVLAIYDISGKKLNGLAPADFFNLINLAFGQKRKQLVSNLAKSYNRSLIINILIDLGLKPSARAEDISLEKWLELAHRIRQIK